MSTLHYIYFGLLGAAIVLLLSQYRHLDLTLRLMLGYLLLIAVFNGTAMYVRLGLDVQNNLFLFHVLTPLEYAILGYVFYCHFRDQPIARVILVSIFAFAIASIFFSAASGLHKNNSLARSVEALLMSIWILAYFRSLFATERILNLKREPLFWINTGLLFYFLGTLLLQGLLNYLIDRDILLAGRLYQFQYLFEYILFIQIIIAGFCRQWFRSIIN